MLVSEPPTACVSVPAAVSMTIFIPLHSNCGLDARARGGDQAGGASCIFVRGRRGNLNLFALCTLRVDETVWDLSGLCWTFAINASVMPANQDRWKGRTQVLGYKGKNGLRAR